MLKVIPDIRDRSNSTWVRNPGVLRGCGVYVHDYVRFGVASGTLLFADGKSARIHNVTDNICEVPRSMFGSMIYIVATASDKDIIFRCEKVKDYTTGITSGLPVYLSNGIVLARALVPADPYTDSIKVYQMAPEGEGHSISDFRLFPEPDGKIFRFFLPDNVYSRGSVNLSVDGVPQIEGEDFVVNSEMGIDGTSKSVIDFINDIPHAGADIRVTFYIGKAAADEIR